MSRAVRLQTWLYDVRYRTDWVDLACLVTAWGALILVSSSGGWAA